ncbi:MAG: metalloregulator ArsR/SmtB family transcription factor [Bdellovibrionaceae bacterium]|nr:metalloregulator ArsR/SmtB family transcription factor [Pseudobdellovibrionaceae bacterium]
MASAISIKKLERSCDEVSRILKALSHPRRLLILGHLLGGPRTVGELVALCHVSQPQMSQFLTRMKYEGLIDSSKEGKFQIYSLADPRLANLMRVVQAEYCKC